MRLVEPLDHAALAVGPARAHLRHARARLGGLLLAQPLLLLLLGHDLDDQIRDRAGAAPIEQRTRDAGAVALVRLLVAVRLRDRVRQVDHLAGALRGRVHGDAQALRQEPRQRELECMPGVEALGLDQRHDAAPALVVMCSAVCGVDAADGAAGELVQRCCQLAAVHVAAVQVKGQQHEAAALLLRLVLPRIGLQVGAAQKPSGLVFGH